MASISKLESYKDGLLCDIQYLFNLSSTAGTLLERGATSQLDTSISSRKWSQTLNGTSNWSQPFACCCCFLCVHAYFYLWIYWGEGFSLCTEIFETASSSHQTEVTEWSKDLVKNFLTPDVTIRRRKYIGKAMKQCQTCSTAHSLE